MIRVALETSTSVGSVAVGRDDRVLCEVSLGVQTRHAESAVPALEHALDLAELDAGAIEAVVVGGGPGSFTGVRVAAATAKGLVAALDVPLLAYPSLLALAASVAADRPVCALFDARRGEVYAGCWRVAAESLEELLSPRVAPVDEVLRLTASAGPLYAGEGAVRYREAVGGAVGSVATLPAHPRAAALLWLAHHHAEGGRVPDVAAWEPAYVRASSAQRGVRG